jgi:hypothetical protein
MSAVGYVSGDPNKVNVTGDTMTGDLILAGAGTDLTVGGVITDTYQGITGDLARFMSTALTTGVTSGGTLSINVNPALIDIAPTAGWIVDYNSSGIIGATNPMLTAVNFAGQTGIALTGPPAQTLTYWSLDSGGNVIQSAVEPTLAQIRTTLFLGASAQFGGINTIVRNLPLIQSQPGAQIFDLISSLGAFNLTSQGNVISANGVNRMIDTTGGDLFVRAYGLNFGTYLNPHVASLAAQSPASFRYATATAILAPFVSNIDVANYDPGGLGVITPIGGGANTTSVHRVFISGSPVANEQIIVQYGQTTFASLAAAIAAIGTGSFTTNPAFTGTLTGYIAATRTATNLSDVTQASFTHAPRFANP